MRGVRVLLAKFDQRQSDLAAAIGVSEATVSGWLAGSFSPSLDNTKAMLAFFRRFDSTVTFDQLIDLELACKAS